MKRTLQFILSFCMLSSITLGQVNVSNFTDSPAAPCSGAIGGTALVTGPSSFCGSGIPVIGANGYSSGTGSTYQWQYSGDGFVSDVNDLFGQTNPASLVTGIVSATTSYRLMVTCTSGLATDYSTIVTITVNPKPTVTVNPPSGSYCVSGSVGLTASGADTYSWSPAAGLNITTGPTVTASPTVTTTYTVTGTITATGCNNSASVTITVHSLPTAVIITPSAPIINAGRIQSLTASGGIILGATILSENFNGATNNWTTINNSTGGTPEEAAWTLRPDGYEYSSYGIWHSNDNSQFYLSISDAQGTGITSTILQSPAFSTTGFTAASVSFYHFFYEPLSGASTGSVEASTNGVSWTPLQTFNFTTGTESDFASAAIPLTASFLNKTTVYVRFKYDGEWRFFWGIDNVSISGNQNASFTWSPLTSLYTNAGATTPYTGTINTTVYSKPAATITYTTTATSCAGCTNTGNVTVTVNPGATWTGAVSHDWATGSNWDVSMVPESLTDVTIPEVTNNPVINSSGNQCGNLTINSTTTPLVINPGTTLTANGITTLGANECLVVKSNPTRTGSFIDNGFSGGGTARIERYLANNGTSSEWHMLSSPITNGTSGIFTSEYLMQYNETAHSFEYIVPPTVPLTPVKGFSVWVNATCTKVFSGPLNTGAQNMSVARTYQGPNPGDFDGWNLVGNPYPSSLNVSLATLTNIENAAYFWDKATGNYKIWVGAGGGNHSKYAPPVQGFFVHCNDASATPSVPGSGTIAFGNAARTHTMTESFYKSTEENPNLLRIKAEGFTNAFSDELSVYFDPQRSDLYEPGADALKFTGNADAPQIYTKIQNTDVSVNAMAFDHPETDVPMGFKVSVPAEYALTASNLESFDNAITVSLTDLKLNVTTDLRTQPVYAFTYDTIDSPDRFILHFHNPSIGIPDQKTQEAIQIYSSGGAVYVKMNIPGTQGKMYVYNILGSEIFRSNLKQGVVNSYPLTVTAGYYIVKVVTETNIYNQKVYLH